MTSQATEQEFQETRNSRLLDRKYRDFFIPTILMAMTTTLSIVVDSMIVGNMLNADALAAVNLAAPVIMAYTTVAVLLGFGAATVISVSFGKRQTEYAREVFTAAVIGLLGIGLLLMLVQVNFLDEITGLLTREPVLRPLVKEFLRVLVYGTPLIIFPMGLVYCLRSDGWVKLASAILIVSNVVNLLLDLVYLGPLQMGIAGSSLATVSGYAVGTMLLLAYFTSKERNLGFALESINPLKVLKLLRTMAATGSPAALSSILITIKILAINTMVQQVAGKTGMIAFSVCLSCLSFVSMFISGAAQTMTPIVGVLHGENDYLGIRFVVKRAVQVLLVSGLSVLVLLELFPEFTLRLFGVRDAAVIAVGVPAIRIFAVSLVGTCFTFFAMFYYMTIGRRRLSTAISVTQGLIVIVPAAYLLSRLIGTKGIWISFSLAEIATLLMILAYYQYLKRREPGRYASILMLDQARDAGKGGFDATCSNDEQETEHVLVSLSRYLENRAESNGTSEGIRTSMKEMLSNFVRHAYPNGTKGYMDIRVRYAPDQITVTLRDGGVAFNTHQHMANLQSDGSGLGLVKASSVEVQYSRIIGFNNTTLTFQRGQ